MTTAQHNAIIRATEYNIRILAKGIIRASGQRFFLTSSRDGRGQHVVLVEGNRLVCDCIAASHGNSVCCHRAAVHVALVDEQNAQMVSERQARLNYAEQQRNAWAESVNWCA